MIRCGFILLAWTYFDPMVIYDIMDGAHLEVWAAVALLLLVSIILHFRAQLSAARCSEYARMGLATAPFARPNTDPLIAALMDYFIRNSEKAELAHALFADAVAGKVRQGGSVLETAQIDLVWKKLSQEERRAFYAVMRSSIMLSSTRTLFPSIYRIILEKRLPETIENTPLEDQIVSVTHELQRRGLNPPVTI